MKLFDEIQIKRLPDFCGVLNELNKPPAPVLGCELEDPNKPLAGAAGCPDVNVAFFKMPPGAGG